MNVIDGPTDRHGFPRAKTSHRRAHGGFRRAVAVDQHDRIAPLVGDVLRARFARHDHRAQLGEVDRFQRSEEWGRQRCNRCARLAELGRDRFDGHAFAPLADDQRRARNNRFRDLENGRIKPKRSHLENPVLRLKLQDPHLRCRQVCDASVRHLNALRRTCGSGCVDDVGRIRQRPHCLR